MIDFMSYKPTIVDVAKAAGVSLTTVSFVLIGRAEKAPHCGRHVPHYPTQDSTRLSVGVIMIARTLYT